MTKKILLLGSGELGKELVIALKRLGQYVVACDKYPNAPAMQVADECRVFPMLDGEAMQRVVEEVKPDIIVPEIEAIRTEKLYAFEKQGIQVTPSARAVNFTMNRKSIRELAHTELQLPTARYRYASSFDELREAAKEVGYPCIVKPLMSSSGHGQSKVDSEAELEGAWSAACQGARGDIMEVIVEGFVRFDYEITLMTVTQQGGLPTLFCPPIGHVQIGGDYRESFQPRLMKNEHLEEAKRMAALVTGSLTGAGIWGVEFFVSESEGVLFSELSPRPHDTGMVTLALTQNLTEFELHARALLGLPIPEITLERQGASAVILSDVETSSPRYVGMEEVCATPKTYLRVFGKPEAHVGRRMGVVVCWDSLASPKGAPLSAEASQLALRQKAKALAAKVSVK